MNIQINDFNLSGDQTVTGARFDESTPQALNLMELAREDGAKLISSNYTPKEISVSGVIIGTSRADLEGNIDTFKKNTMITEGNLDIDYGVSYRRFSVNCAECIVTRERQNITVAAFELKYIAADPPFAQEIDAVGGSPNIDEALSADRLTLVQEALSCNFSGTAEPKPSINFEIDVAGNLGNISLKNDTTNTQIDVFTAVSNGDLLIIDTKEKTVQKNYSNIEFEGVFPKFNLGSNTLTLGLSATSSALDEQQTSYNSADNTTNNLMLKLGQSFQAGATATIDSIQLLGYIGTDYSGINDIRVSIETDSAGSPSGSAVVAYSQAIIQNIDLPHSLAWFTVNFALSIPLVSGTTYWITISCGGHGYDGPFYWKGHTVSQYVNGVAKKAPNFTDWGNASVADFCFQVYKFTPPTWDIGTKINYQRRYL